MHRFLWWAPQAHDFPVATVQYKCHQHYLAIASRLLQPILIQARIAFLDDYFAFMLSGMNRPLAMPVQQPTFITHHPVDPLVVDSVVPFQSQASPDAAITIGGAVLDHICNGLFDNDVIAARWRLSQVCPFRRAISLGQYMAA